MHSARLDKVRELLNQRKLDALLVTHLPNIFYLSGFTGSTAALIVTPDASHMFVDPRYTIQAQAQCKQARVVTYTGKQTTAALAELIDDLNPGAVGYESDNVTVAYYRKLRSLTDRRTSFRATSGIVEGLRSTKDRHEIELIQKAAGIADAVFEAALTKIKPGLTEKDVALIIDSSVRKLGGDKEAFETIAAFGPNAACPHASPTDTILKLGHLLKLDFGARLDNYNSDITRTVCLGNPTAKQKAIYQIVLDAQLKAIDAIAPGKKGREIDAVARDYIASQGYGDNFGHGLGHALGIEVHDGPAFSKLSEVVLKPGMVVTVEPGIYIEGWGGVRIEDDVLVTDSGFDILTHAAKELLSLGI